MFHVKRNVGINGRRITVHATQCYIILYVTGLNHFLVISFLRPAHILMLSFFLFFVAIRCLERKALVKSAFLQGINITLALIVPTLATVGTFCMHVATGKDLSTPQVCNSK